MKLRWPFWTFWIIVNAITSFCWAIFLGSSSSYFTGILCGIACFIIFYTLLDGYLRKQQYFFTQRALVHGVYIKAAMQVLNLLVFSEVFADNFNIVPEIWAGSIAIMLVEEVLPHAPANSFTTAFFMTLTTGAMLSIFVGVISFIAYLIIKPQQPNTSDSP